VSATQTKYPLEVAAHFQHEEAKKRRIDLPFFASSLLRVLFDMSKTNILTVIHLVRHGLVHNPNEVHYGRLPRFRLSEEGQRQAAAAAKALNKKPIAALYSSPLLRARQTAQAIAAHHPHLKLQRTPLLLEICTPWDGTPISDMIARDWDLYSGNEAPYEQPDHIVARARRFLDGVRARHTSRHVVAVSHGDVITFTILWAKGQPLDWRHKAENQRLGLSDNYPQTASITTLTFSTRHADELPAVSYLRPY
jgi:broad specificity phosphatase PhoE